MDALRLVRDATSSDEGLGAAALEALAEVSQVEAGEIVDNLRTACDTEFAAISIQRWRQIQIGDHLWVHSLRG